MFPRLCCFRPCVSDVGLGMAHKFKFFNIAFLYRLLAKDYTDRHCGATRICEGAQGPQGKPWDFKHLTVKHIYYPLAKSNGKILQLMRALEARGGDRRKKRRIISVTIALVPFAITVRDVGSVGEFVYVCCLFGIPCLWVCIFTGRNMVGEAIGWMIQILSLIRMLFPGL